MPAHPQETSQTGVDLIKKFEGCHDVHSDGTVHAYKDPAGIPTIGYGHTKGVKMGQVITMAQAEDFLEADLKTAERAVKRYVKVDLSPAQFDALVSFTYNLGSGNLRSSTLLKKLNRGDYDSVPSEMTKWNKARVNGVLKPLKGLTRRRAAEGALFTMDEPLSADGGERVAQKPRAKNPDKSTAKDGEILGIGVAGVSAIASKIASELEPFLGVHDVVQWSFIGLSVVAAGLVAYKRANKIANGAD